MIFGIGIIAVVIGVSWIMLNQVDSSEDYVNRIQSISGQSKSFTQEYEDSIARWRDGQIDKREMLQITDTHLERLDNLIVELNNIAPPEKFRNAHEFTTGSISNEMESDRHMRNYIDTGNNDEYQKSVEFLQKAFDDETTAFAEFSKASKIK